MGLFTPNSRVGAAAAICGLLLAGAALAAAPEAPPVKVPASAPAPAPAQQPAAADPATATTAAPAVDPAKTPTADQKPKEAKSDLPASQFSGVINAVGLTAAKGADGKLVPAKAANFDQIIFAPDGDYDPFPLAIVNARDKAALELSANKRVLPVVDDKEVPKAKLSARDLIVIDVDNPVNPTKVVKIVKIVRPVSPFTVGWTVIGVTAGLLLVAYLASGGRPTRFIVGHDGRLSNSQFQLALWFGVVAIAYGSMLLLRVFLLGVDFIGGIGLTENVLMLTGLSAVTFGGAKLVTTQKQNAAAGQAAQRAMVAANTAKATADAAQTMVSAAATLDAADPVSIKANAAAQDAISSAAYSTTAAVQLAGTAAATPTAAQRPAKTAAEVRPSFLDLFQNGQGETDLGDFQMVLISVVAAGIFAVSSLHAMLMLHVATDIILPAPRLWQT
jgi:hypothetical protein